MHGGSCGKGGGGGERACGSRGAGGRGGCGVDGGGAGEIGDGGDEGGAHPGLNTPCALHASGHIAAKESVMDRPAGGSNAMMRARFFHCLKGREQILAAAAAASPFCSSAMLRARATLLDSPEAQSRAPQDG